MAEGNARSPVPLTVTPEYVRMARLRAQHLYRAAPVSNLVEVVRSLCGVNAQAWPAMLLSLRARIRGLEAADVSRAMTEDRSLVMTWAMRGTLHLIDFRDRDWMVDLLGPRFIKKFAGRRLELGLDENMLARGSREIPAILTGREPMTREELADALIARGIGIDRKSQAPYHLIVYAALNGIICAGPDQDGAPTYSLVSERIGKYQPMPRDAALECLCFRYLEGYGPADGRDFAAWSGLPVTEAKKGLEMARDRRSLKPVIVEGRELWAPELPKKLRHAGRVVNLLPAFDSLVLGYADRELLVPQKYQKEVYHGGQTVPVVLVDGIAAGTWRYRRRGKKLDISVAMFDACDSAARGLIETEAADIGRFMGMEASLAYRL